MVGIFSLTDSSTGAETAASGIGRNLRSFNLRSGSGLGSRGDPRFYGGIFCGGMVGGNFRSLELFGRRGIEDAVGQGSKRGLDGRQDLPAGAAAAGVIQGIHFRLDLRAEFVGRAPELVEKARNLAADLGHFLGAEKDQRQKKQEDHLAREATEIHISIIMRERGNRKLVSCGDRKYTKRKLAGGGPACCRNWQTAGPSPSAALRVRMTSLSK